MARIATRLQEKEDLLKQDFSGQFDLLTLSCHGWMAAAAKGLAGRDLSDRAGTLRWIVDNCRDRTGLEVSRPGHNHPLAVCILGLYAGVAIREWPDCVLFTASKAGESQVSSAIAGALSGALSGEDIHLTEPKELLTGLANYRQILLRAENCAAGTVAPNTRPFRQMEHDLTLSASLDLARFHKDHPLAEKARKKAPVEAAQLPIIPDRKNKRKWKEYIKEKTKEKKRRRR
jgi:hypothetical protein